MKEYISIKNFGPLKNIEDLKIKQITVLIGESASGKSSLMKVVAMMRYLYKMANIRSYLRHSNITKSPFRVRLSAMMKRQGMGDMFGKDSRIVYRTVLDDGKEYELKIENGRVVIPTIDKKHLEFCKVSYISENRNLIPTWAQKASSNKGASLGYYFHETNDDFVKASEGEKTVDMNYLGMKMSISHPRGKPTRYRISPKDERHKPIELTEASSGIQTSAPLALIMEYMANDFSFKDAFNRSVMSYLYEMERLSKFKAVSEPSDLPKIVYIHIEEPELSLFPDAQCRMIDELIFKSTHAKEDRTINLMLATHSPYILNYLNIVLNQRDANRAQLDDDKTAVYRLYEGEAQDLLMQNEKGSWIVDSYDLSEVMSNIYKEFVSLEV